MVDDAEVLGDARARIGEALADYERRSSHQVAVLTVRTLEGESIDDFAERVFKAWKLGRKDVDDGVLLVVVPDDRKMRIEVGYGLEGTLTDAASGRIIRDVLAPAFKRGDYGGGVERGVEAIIARLDGREAPDGDAAPPAPAPQPGLQAGDDMPWQARLLFGAFIFGILGLFTAVGIATPRQGWFLYFFLIPFWAVFPIVIVGFRGAIGVLAAHLIGFPAAKLALGRSAWYRRGGWGGSSSGRSSSSGWSSFSSGFDSGGSSFDSGSSFSGGGGSSGGGGASGSW